MLAAAYLALNQRGEGPSPSGPTQTEGQANRRWQPPRKRPSASLEGSTPSPSACALGRAAEVLVLQTSEVGSTPAGHFRGSANGRLPRFERGDEGSFHPLHHEPGNRPRRPPCTGLVPHVRRCKLSVTRTGSHRLIHPRTGGGRSSRTGIYRIPASPVYCRRQRTCGCPRHALPRTSSGAPYRRESAMSNLYPR